VRGALALALAAACGSSTNKSPDARIDGPPVSPDAPTQTITFTLTGRPNVAATFSFVAAYQDGTGPWQLAPPPSGDTYTFSVASPTWSFAWTCVTAIDRTVMMYRFAVAERTSLTDQLTGLCTDRNPTPVALSGTISNAPAMGSIGVAWGSYSVDAVGNAYTFDPGVAPATHDLVAVHRPPFTTSYVADSAVVQRGLAVAASTTAPIDFRNAPATQTAAITGVPANGIVLSGVTTASGTYVDLSYYTAPPATGGYLAAGLAASQAAAGDVYSQLIVAGQLNSETYDAAVTAHTFVAPPSMGFASSSVASNMPYPQIRTTWPAYPSAVGYTWSASQNLTASQCGSTVACTVSWDAFLSPGAVTASPRFQMPDLSALSGWDPRLAFQTGTLGAVFMGAEWSSAGATDFPPVAYPPAGTARTHAHTGSQIVF
jgi:hypothetical protein